MSAGDARTSASDDEPTDEQLLVRLREVFEQVDPPPAKVFRDGYTLFCIRDMDEDIDNVLGGG